MDTAFTQIGIGGIIALLVLREVFGFLRGRNGSGKITSDDLRRIRKALEQIHDLWEWHNVSDADGVKLWYVRRSLEESMDQLSKNISKQTEVLSEMLRSINENRSDIKVLVSRK